MKSTYLYLHKSYFYEGGQEKNKYLYFEFRHLKMESLQRWYEERLKNFLFQIKSFNGYILITFEQSGGFKTFSH